MAVTMLRVNGLGSPRAFFTPIIREVGFRIPVMVRTMPLDWFSVAVTVSAVSMMNSIYAAAGVETVMRT